MLEGLKNAAKLANILGLQDRSGTIFALLAAVACGAGGTAGPPRWVAPRRAGAWRLAAAQQKLQRRLRRARLAALIIGSRPTVDLDLPHVLSLDVILNKGLELASYNKEAWSHILRSAIFHYQHPISVTMAAHNPILHLVKKQHFSYSILFIKSQIT